MLCWISKGIVNLTRDEGCDGIIHGVEFDNANSNPRYFVQVLGHESRTLHKKFYYLDQEQMLVDFATLKDCYVSLMVGSNNTGSRVRMYNPPQDLTNTLAQEERETTRNRSRADRDNGSFTSSVNETLNDALRQTTARLTSDMYTTTSPGTYRLNYNTVSGPSGDVVVSTINQDSFPLILNSSGTSDGT